MKPVYLINGFLDSGKTEFITFTIAQEYFKIKGTTLLLLCEEGEKEYPEELLKKYRTEVAVIENEEDFNPDNLIKLEKKYKADRIIIEYNGMWNMKDFTIPRSWRLEQQITMIDGSTFPMYYTNMKSLVAEMIRKSELIIVNRCDEVKDLNSYKRNIKAVNQTADVIFEDANGEITEILEEDLPYDISKQVIDLDDKTYGIWYLDAMDHAERYMGKTLRFIAKVYLPKGFPSGFFVPGRQIMTCCAADIAFLGYACACDGHRPLKDGEWIVLTARFSVEPFEGYRDEQGPVLHAISYETVKAPKEEVLSFS